MSGRNAMSIKGDKMSTKFEVGKTYARDGQYIRVTKRTEKTIWVDNDQHTWRMRIRHDRAGDEYVADSTVPLRHRGVRGTFYAGDEEEWA